jgi:23S rRNA (adenine2503-C2)-methyltransferase
MASATSTVDRPSLYQFERTELGELLKGQPRYRVDQVWQGLYGDMIDVGELSTLPKALRAQLAEELPAALTLETERISDDNTTVKFLWSLHDGYRVETVLMLYPDRATVCVSSQAGCAMGCGFCATGQGGFDRHLSVGEIVEQVVRAAQRARALGRRVSNIVYMGMGEPLANPERVWGSLVRLHDAVGISARHLTVSTVGIVPAIRDLVRRPLPVNLAVSLHAANDTLRDELVPINRRYPLADLEAACADDLEARRRRLSFEWAMISGVNDRASDAEELAAISNRLRAHVNLIPLNPTPGFGVPGTPLATVYKFRDYLEELGVNATVRRNRGTDIDAACGQLARRAEPSSAPVTLTPRRS